MKINKLVNRGRSLLLSVATLSAASLFTTSCQDFLDVSSKTVIDADDNHLSSARDSIYSVIGILNKMQAIADRTVLLGEARADLLDITSSTSKDLRDLALFNVGDDNKYNAPRDYYAIINNCNYFITNVDTAMTNNRNENVYLNEYAVVKAIRAWTYLQLVTTYGKVPFVTEPILSKDDGEKQYPMYDIQQVCDYFISEDGLTQLANNEKITYPWYGNIKGTPSRLFYIQLNLILGDLYLWRGSLNNSQDDYMKSATCYYNYIRKRNGTTTNSSYPTGAYRSYWMDDTWDKYSYSTSWAPILNDNTNAANSEVISIIPMDSIPSEGNYSEIRSIFNTRSNDNEKFELEPSAYMQELSAAQDYCYYDETSEKFIYAPKSLGDNLDGDLRLKTIWSKSDNYITNNGQRVSAQNISKFNSTNGNVSIYRRGQVYLRFAEAINRAGFPRYAYQILASGVNNDVIEGCITPFLDSTDSLTVTSFAFPNNTYAVNAWRSDIPGRQYNNRSMGSNHIGIHGRGCGEAAFNDYYKMPYGTAVIDTIPVYEDNQDLIGYKYIVHKDKETPGLVQKQIEAVEDMLVNEQALETAFEGYRFYDLMRVAYRRNDPSFLAKKVYARKGSKGTNSISTDLLNQNNWFLKWNNQIGILQ